MSAGRGRAIMHDRIDVGTKFLETTAMPDSR